MKEANHLDVQGNRSSASSSKLYAINAKKSWGKRRKERQATNEDRNQVRINNLGMSSIRYKEVWLGLQNDKEKEQENSNGTAANRTEHFFESNPEKAWENQNSQSSLSNF